jgi:plastocyanin
MVRLSTFLSAAALLSSVLARPLPDSSINEPAVSAPNGTPITEGTPEATKASKGSNGYEGSNGYGSKQDTTSSVMMSETTSSAMGYETSSSTMAHETTTSMMEETTSSMMMDTTSSSMMMETTSTTTAYGSGSTSWDSGYNDCVQQCIASYGAPSATGSYTPPTTTGSAGSYGTGATHTVIVAPTQGVLRFVPFTVNAQVGDTVMFNWMANNHTVTKSSALLPCNRSEDAPVFASGVHDKGFSFTQVVNSTDPTYYFCGTPGHCEKGMFGIINPPVNATPDASMDAAMPSLLQSDADLFAMSEYAKSAVANNAAASTWGSNIDITQMPDWSKSLVADNVLYMRTFLGMNPDTLQSDGSVSLAAMDTTPMKWPESVNNAATPGAPANAESPAPEVSSPTKSGASSTPTGGALSSIASPRVLVAVVSAAATFFLL